MTHILPQWILLVTFPYPNRNDRLDKKQIISYVRNIYNGTLFEPKNHITYSSSVAHFQKRSSQSTPLTSLLEIASMKLMNA